MFVSHGEPKQATDDVSLSWQPFSSRLRYLTLASCSEYEYTVPVISELWQMLASCGRGGALVGELGQL